MLISKLIDEIDNTVSAKIYPHHPLLMNVNGDHVELEGEIIESPQSYNSNSNTVLSVLKFKFLNDYKNLEYGTIQINIVINARRIAIIRKGHIVKLRGIISFKKGISVIIVDYMIKL